MKYRFFRKKDNAKIYHKIAVATMKDKTPSAFEFQLAMRLMNVGATDEEVGSVYRQWCTKHKLRPKARFVTHVIPDARLATADYITDWNERQPKRRKHGTTRQQILEAIQSGVTQPKEIARSTQLKGSSVRMQLKRMAKARRLVRTSQGYAIASDYSP